MKYKVGDKVKVRSDLKINRDYGSQAFVREMSQYIGKVVTIKETYSNKYNIEEDGGEWFWTDEMLEGLAEDELTAEEAIKIQAEMCRNTVCKDCAIDRLRYDSHCECCEFRSKNPNKVVEVLKQWKKDHEKKPIETELVSIVRVIEYTGAIKKCVYEEEITERENPMDAKERVLKEYCQKHTGKFFTVFESICRVKE